MTQHLVTSSKTEKWDFNFSQPQGDNKLHLKHQYQAEAINSVPATEKYEKSLTKIKKTIKGY